jgi:hypothetical protein
MKKNLRSVALIAFAALASCSSDDDANTNADESLYVKFNDVSFKQALVDNPAVNTNYDEEISFQEAKLFTEILSLENLGIEDLTGIEAFINIKNLSAFNNQLTQVDLSKNTKLKQILLENNKLVALDISMLPEVEDLKVHTNNLNSLNVANGNNFFFSRMQAQDNANLNCIQIDQDFNPGSNWLSDMQTNYSYTDCNEPR